MTPIEIRAFSQEMEKNANPLLMKGLTFAGKYGLKALQTMRIPLIGRSKRQMVEHVAKKSAKIFAGQAKKNPWISSTGEQAKKRIAANLMKTKYGRPAQAKAQVVTGLQTLGIGAGVVGVGSIVGGVKHQAPAKFRRRRGYY